MQCIRNITVYFVGSVEGMKCEGKRAAQEEEEAGRGLIFFYLSN